MQRSVTLLCVLAGVANAQGPQVWERTLELSGNYLYGNTEQAILSARTGVSRNDSLVSVRVETRFLIGVTDRADVGRVMDRRSWVVSGSVDFRPYAPQSQFFFGSVERSLELRIDRRVNGGIGQKVSFLRDSITKFDVSLGVLGEQSILPQATPAGGSSLPTVNNALVRLSGRMRYQRNFTSRVKVDHVTSYRPELSAIDRYLASSVSAVSFSVGENSSLRVSLQNDFDSLARSRGARSNQNGQLLVGASTKF